jgi:aconitate decarboxylase
MSDHAGAPNVHTRGIAAFVSALSYDRIPAEVIERIKLLILDSLGCAIYGAQLEWCRILRQTLESLDATRTTSVWGTPLRLSSPHAALMNGTQVQGFELDDVHRQGVLHVGAVTLPALIAVAESHADLSGRDFLTAAWPVTKSAPRRTMHGAGAYRTGLAFRRDRWRLIGGRRRRARAGTFGR